MLRNHHVSYTQADSYHAWMLQRVCHSEGGTSMKVTPPPSGEAMKQWMKEEKKRLLKEKGHDCWETVCTAMDEGSYYYYCCICNDILQS